MIFYFPTFLTTYNLHLANELFPSIRNVSQAPRRTLESGLPSACSDRKTREACLCRRSDPNRYKKFGCSILFQSEEHKRGRQLVETTESGSWVGLDN